MMELTFLVLDGGHETVSDGLVHARSGRDSKRGRVLGIRSGGEVLAKSERLRARVRLRERL